jgi:hypothetical protein
VCMWLLLLLLLLLGDHGGILDGCLQGHRICQAGTAGVCQPESANTSLKCNTEGCEAPQGGAESWLEGSDMPQQRVCKWLATGGCYQ